MDPDKKKSQNKKKMKEGIEAKRAARTAGQKEKFKAQLREANKKPEQKLPKKVAKTVAAPKKEKALEEAAFQMKKSPKDECYYKVKRKYKVFPSAYASGAIAKCRKVGAANWGNKSKK